jgi:acetyltransferase-like isoleucine patch superfamily enzyme
MLILFDLLYVVLGIVFYGGALVPALLLGAWAHERLGLVGLALALPLAYLAFLLALVLAVGLVRLLLVPTPRVGRHAMPFSGGLAVWACHLLLQRFINLGPIEDSVFYLGSLRTLYLALMGARVHPSANVSGGTTLMDLTLLEIGRGSIVGAGCAIFGHYVVEKHLVLARNRIGARVVVGARTLIGPGLEAGDGAFIGAACAIGPRVTIGAGARVEGGSTVLPGTSIPAGEIWAGVPARRVERGWKDLAADAAGGASARSEAP